MTLVLGITGTQSIWVLADRRLSHSGKPVKEDARKLMFLETKDGLAILGYAGLGATALGNEPADWMAAVLRGRNLPLEASLEVLAQAVRTQVGWHLAQLAGEGALDHYVVIPAFLGKEPRMYLTALRIEPDRIHTRFLHKRITARYASTSPSLLPKRIMVGGSGAKYLMRDLSWQRDVLRIVKACDNGRISPRAVGGHLAALNNIVHTAAERGNDATVGQRCIVAWRRSREGSFRGGGGQYYYSGTEREGQAHALPNIASGMDVAAIVGAMMPHFAKRAQDRLAGELDKGPDLDALNAELAKTPDEPDENLR